MKTTIDGRTFIVQVTGGDGQPASLPNAPGIYAIYDAEGALQYVGMSRKVLHFNARTKCSMPSAHPG